MEFKTAFPKTIIMSLAMVLSLSAFGTSAEDGTSGTLPDSLHQCEIVAATWSESAPDEIPVATPVASPIASPVASPIASPVGEPVSEIDEALTNDLESATHAILDCMSDNNVEVLLKITGEEFRSSWLGLGTSVSDEDFSLLLPMMPNLPYELVSIENASADGDTATATIKFTIGRQLMTSEWTYKLADIDDQTVWQVQSEMYLPTDVPSDAAVMDVIVDDGYFTINTETTPSGDIVINVQNVGSMPHEVLIVRTTGALDAGDFAASDGIPSGTTFIGQLTLPAGSQGTIVLTDVRAGSYTVVDMLPDENGLPNVSSGMITEFTVE